MLIWSEPRPGPDWVKTLDKGVEEFNLQFNHIFHCLFYLVRYPDRQIIPDDEPEKTLVQTWNEDIDSRLSTAESEIAATQTRSRILEGLSPTHKRQLCALLYDSLKPLKDFIPYRAVEENRARRKIVRSAVSRVKKLEARQTRLKKDLLEFRQLVSGKLPFVSQDQFTLLDKCIENISIFQLPTEDECKKLKDHTLFLLSDVARNRPETDETIKIYWFYRDECKLSGDESEVRVGLIRNEFWTRYGVTEVNVRESYDGVENFGCEAVRVLVQSAVTSTEEVATPIFDKKS